MVFSFDDKSRMVFLRHAYERILFIAFVCVFVISACAQKATKWNYIRFIVIGRQRPLPGRPKTQRYCIPYSMEYKWKHREPLELLFVYCELLFIDDCI
jgi:hypothetical protein